MQIDTALPLTRDEGDCSANDCLSEARQARLSFSIKNNLFLRLSVARFISNGTIGFRK